MRSQAVQRSYCFPCPNHFPSRTSRTRTLACLAAILAKAIPPTTSSIFGSATGMYEDHDGTLKGTAVVEKIVGGCARIENWREANEAAKGNAS